MAEPEARRNPFEGVTDYFSELSRMREVGTHGREHPREEHERTHASAWVPTTDILLRGTDLVIRVELAGVEPGSVDLGFAHGHLSISGSRAGDEEGVQYYVRERFHGAFRRTVTLPEGTTREQITARLVDGLVEVTVRGAAAAAAPERISLDDARGEPQVRSVD